MPKLKTADNAGETLFSGAVTDGTDAWLRLAQAIDGKTAEMDGGTNVLTGEQVTIPVTRVSVYEAFHAGRPVAVQQGEDTRSVTIAVPS